MFQEGTVVKIRKAIYGLKQSGRLWNSTLDDWLRSKDFHRSETEPCLYRRTEPDGKLLLVAVYVDDLLIAVDDQRTLDAFEVELRGRFRIKEFEDPDVLLGIRVQHNRAKGELTLDQHHYIRCILAQYGMDDSKPIGTPMATSYKDSPADPEEPLPDVPFRELIGSLLYASTRTRPDIATAVGTLTRHMAAFNKAHWTAAKHILRYLRGTLDRVILIKREDTSEATLHGYADATFASDISTSRSRTGSVIFYGGAPVSWIPLAKDCGCIQCRV